MTTEVLTVEEIRALHAKEERDADHSPTWLGPYQVLRKISSGGMADVFVARRDFGLGVEMRFAIKRLLPRFARDPDHVRLFIEEARLSGSLNHCNIPHYFEFGLMDGQYFLVMDLVDGRDLKWIRAAVARTKMAIPIPIALHVVVSVCDALAYLHGKKDSKGCALGIVHRDVTPANILLSSAGDVKLIDFGIFKSSQRLSDGRIRGKASYMSPEQIRSPNRVDRRSDVFALGVVLHELLAGRSLFAGATVSESIHQVQVKPIPPASRHNPEVPARLDRITARCLRRDPERRYQTMMELRDDLEQLRRSSKAHVDSAQVRRWLGQVCPRASSSHHRRWRRPGARSSRPIGRSGAVCFDDKTPFVGTPRELLDRCRPPVVVSGFKANFETDAGLDSEDTAILRAFARQPRIGARSDAARPGGATNVTARARSVLTAETVEEITARSSNRRLLLLLLLSFVLCSFAVYLVLQAPL